MEGQVKQNAVEFQPHRIEIYDINSSFYLFYTAMFYQPIIKLKNAFISLIHSDVCRRDILHLIVFRGKRAFL